MKGIVSDFTLYNHQSEATTLTTVGVQLREERDQQRLTPLTQQPIASTDLCKSKFFVTTLPVLVLVTNLLITMYEWHI